MYYIFVVQLSSFFCMNTTNFIRSLLNWIRFVVLAAINFCGHVRRTKCRYGKKETKGQKFSCFFLFMFSWSVCMLCWCDLCTYVGVLLPQYIWWRDWNKQQRKQQQQQQEHFMLVYFIMRKKTLNGWLLGITRYHAFVVRSLHAINTT